MKIDPKLVGDLDAPIASYGYNPASWSQRLPICVLAMIAFVIAAYMGLYQWKLIDSAWDPVFGDQTENVLDSEVSHKMGRWFRVPDSTFGALAYLGDAVFGLIGSTRRWQYRPWLVILFGIDVIPLGIVSAVLVVLQGTVVGSWCFLCLITAVISLILVYMAYDEVWTSVRYLIGVWRESRSGRELWKALWGYPSELSEAVAQAMIVGERVSTGRRKSLGAARHRRCRSDR